MKDSTKKRKKAIMGMQAAYVRIMRIMGSDLPIDISLPPINKCLVLFIPEISFNLL